MNIQTTSRVARRVRQTVSDNIRLSAKGDGKKGRVADLLQEYSLEVRPDLAGALLLTTGRDRHLEKEFRRGAAKHVYEGLGISFFLWLLLKPFVMWAISQIIDDLLSS